MSTTTTTIQPLTLYGQHGPNPHKIRMLLNELSLPHTITAIPFDQVKSPTYTAVNPNGRLPALHDPNTNLTIWESGAIMQYILATYDKDHKLSFDPAAEPENHWHAAQWLFFQTTGQGPYYGQAVWFTRYHHEKLPSAVERYVKEVNRVTGVLEGHLEKEAKRLGTEQPWLVGGRFSYVDLAFVPWQLLPGKLLKESGEYDESKFPYVTKWMVAMLEREAIKSVVAEQH